MGVEIADDWAVPDGAELLDELHAAYTRYVVFPSPEAADAVTLYVAATHAQTAWEHATRLVVKSPLKRCGKTRLQEACRETVHNPLPTTNISPAALARSIDEFDPPVIILDEADTVFGKKSSESTDDIRGIVNSGHSRGWPYRRWNANTRSMETCPTFAMAIIGGIGSMPDTIEDRAVVIEMRRRAPGERVAQWRARRAVPELRAIRDRLHDWVTGIADQLAIAEPDLPVEDRAADTWESLVAIADAAGGDWPGRARTACQVLTDATVDFDDGTAGERLLSDLKKVFGSAEAMFTEDILEKLRQIDEAPWNDWRRGDGLKARGLAGLLRDYGVKSKNVRIGEHQAKGYCQEDLADVWRRYVPAVPPSQDDKDPGLSREDAGDGNGTEADSGSVPRSDQGKQTPWDAGTDGTQDPPDCAICGFPIHPKLAALGERTHPACEPLPQEVGGRPDEGPCPDRSHSPIYDHGVWVCPNCERNAS